MVKENLSRIYIREKNVISRDIAGETVLVPIRGNLADMQYIFTLNPVGAFIWEELTGDKNLADIIEGVLENFDISREQATADILEFIEQVTETGLASENS